MLADSLFHRDGQAAIPGVPKGEFGCKRRARSAQNPPPPGKGRTGSSGKLPQPHNGRKTRTREFGRCHEGFSFALGSPDALRVSELRQDCLELIGMSHFQMRVHL